MSFSWYHMPHVKWKYWHGLLYYTANGFCEVRYFSLIVEQKKKKQKNKHSNSLMYNLRSFVRSKRKKEWTEEKSVKSVNIWVSIQHLELPLLLLLYSTTAKRNQSVICSRLFNVSQKRLGIWMQGRVDIFLP